MAARVPDFGAAPDAFRRAFDDRFAGLEGMLGDASSSSWDSSTPSAAPKAAPCEPCRTLLASEAYSPERSRAPFSFLGAGLSTWVAVVVVAVLAAGVCVAMLGPGHGFSGLWPKNPKPYSTPSPPHTADAPAGVRLLGASSSAMSVVEVSNEADAVPTAVSVPAVVLYHAEDWCHHCKEIAPVFEKLAKEFAAEDRLRFFKCHQKHVSEADKDLYKIHGLPTLILFLPGGRHERLVGNRPEKDLREFLSLA